MNIKKLKQKWENFIDLIRYKYYLKTKEIEYFILYSCEIQLNTKNLKEEDIQAQYDYVHEHKEDYFPDFKKVEFECVEREIACENITVFTVKTTCYLTKEELQDHLDYMVNDVCETSGSLTTQFGFLPAISLNDSTPYDSRNGYLTPFFKKNDKFIYNDYLVNSEFERILNK